MDPKVRVAQPPVASTATQAAARNRTAVPNRGPANAVLEQEVRIAAYELYERRGGTPDHAVEDWLMAEAQVRARRSRAVGR